MTAQTGSAAAGLDVVFANAGGGEFRSLDSITVEHVANTFDTNIDGTIFTVQKTLPLLNEGASIVLTGSTAASKASRRSASTPRPRPPSARSAAPGPPS